MKPRALLAVAGGCVFLVAWVSAAMVLSDYFVGLGRPLQLAYFAFAGCLWVLPVTWLMLWAARAR